MLLEYKKRTQSHHVLRKICPKVWVRTCKFLAATEDYHVSHKIIFRDRPIIQLSNAVVGEIMN